MMKIRRNQAGFTLMELMVVIVIVAILAAVAVPLYINYVKDAQRTEAKGAIGAIVTAEQVVYQREGAYVAYTDAQFTTPPTSGTVLNCDVSESQRLWTFDVTAASATGFTVEAKGKTTGSAKGLEVKLEYSRAADPKWTEK